jgi:uncharacterized protein YceK
MKKIFILLIVPFIVSSCATVFTGTRDTISFNSTPEGAMVYKDGLELCKTPCRIPIKRSLNDVDIEFKLDGYETRLFTLDKEFNIVSVINLGNLLGWAIDAATGSIMKYDRKSYELELKQKNLSALENPKEIHIDTKQNIVDIYVVQK